ncbi:N-6 DNA methylase [bacterium]
MANERKTENIIRNKLRKLGYFDDSEIIVEEQKSDNSVITKLFAKASKSGNGTGYPEFIIRSHNSDVLIVVECKANILFHESQSKDKPKDYAVDGVLHYASFLKDNFHIIAIGASGAEDNYRISTYQWNKAEKRFLFRKFFDLQKYEDYYEIFHLKDNVVLTEEDLMQYAKKLHDQMRDEAKLKESEKPLLVAALLLALDNDDFIRELPTIQNSKKLAIRIIESIQESLEDSGILKSKIDTLVREFAFIKTHTYLTSGKIDHQNPSHNNNSLHKFLVDIRSKVYPFVKKVNNIDIIGKFYSEFLRYTGGDGKGLGIVLTPTHITELFCDLAEVNKNSKVLDICTGTGGFLISAMKKMIENDPTVAEIDNIYKNSLVGIETQTNMFALAVANMIIRGDGKTNLSQANCFDIKTAELQKFGCNVGLINPPYSQKKKGEMELLFVKKLLDSLVVGGIGVAIIPQSTVMSSKTNNNLKNEILKYHTIKAVVSMPDELFYPTNTVTCIVVFEAHKPHNKNKKTWFGYFKNDGFEKVRNDYNAKIKNYWLDSFYNNKEFPGFSVLQEVDGNDEWLVEAYLDTDYEKLNNSFFIKSLKDYVTYKFYNELTDIASNKSFDDRFIELKIHHWQEFKIEDLFEVVGSKTTPKRQLEEFGRGKYPYITTQTVNNGVENFYAHFTDTGNVLVIDSAVKGYCSYQRDNFSASDHVEKLIPKFEMNTYIALFLQTIINLEQFRYSYGRKYNQERIRKTKIKLPFKNKQPNWQFMQEYIKSLPYSARL